MPDRSEQAAEYRRRARQCHEQATSARNPEDRAHWLELSREYQLLAEAVEQTEPEPPQTS